jgi:flagellar FliJ protein
MTRSERLHRVADRIEREQDAAARRLAELREELDRQEAQLASLRSYLESYREGMSDVQHQGGAAARLGNYARFVERLHEAVREQEQRVAAARSAHEGQRLRWQEQRARAKAIDSVAERHAARERKAFERAEQRQVDDIVLQRFLASGS